MRMYDFVWCVDMYHKSIHVLLFHIVVIYYVNMKFYLMKLEYGSVPTLLEECTTVFF